MSICLEDLFCVLNQFCIFGYSFLKNQVMSNKNEMTRELQKELNSISEGALLSPKTIRKKLIMWVIRNSISVFFIWYFWDHWFMKYALWILIPLSLLSLISIIGFNYFLKRKIARSQGAVDELLDVMKKNKRF